MLDGSGLSAAALTGLGCAALVGIATWIVSSLRRDVSLVDRVWSVLIVAAAFGFLARQPFFDGRLKLMVLLLVAWAIRLALYVTWRNWGHGEDRRYQQIRSRNEPHFALKSLYLIFGLQAFLAALVAAPWLALPLVANETTTWSVLDAVGAAMALFGVVFEAVADQQMARFKAAAENKGRVMDRGLWRYSRHPNYFGECCVWWGLWLMAVGGGASGWAIVSPIVMTVLLLKVSGVSLLEKDIVERRPAYRDYIAKTNSFIPGPRKGSPP